ncbi:hypothetical protein P0Y43_14780 [Pseudomonas entomophila]|uniref:hypothetical protein n=1 Tax=Pseudomonas entomophila TaxID=312306 RepID=UPI0023D7EC77|nr:hypothetical protein [Pseudomonas entomophila]MDF0731977.1 hypothetical protein [Pseudomonas entomophila]
MTARSILLGAALGLCAQAQANEASNPHITVPVGKPTMIHQLRYEVLYSEKPFELATLYYYDNGLYKIVSPGEDHYGVYLIEGGIGDPSYRISYLSLPSDDWGGNVAKHELKFDNQRQVFEQQATTHADQGIPPQHGTFTTTVNTIVEPAEIRWRQP